MGFLKRIWRWVFPPRASTQTWMLLTFALFVGVAVVSVALYVVLELRGETRTAMQHTLRAQAERIAVQVEQAGSRQARRERVREIGRLTGLHLVVAGADSVWWDVQGGTLRRQNTPLRRREARAMAAETERYAVRNGPQGAETFYVTLRRPASGLTVRVGQPEPPLYDLVEWMRTVLLVGMGAALLLALLGSWLASYQVITPLRRIRNTARAVSLGDFEGEIHLESRAAEFQDLAESLNRASDTFREKIEELERLAQLQSEFIGNVSHEVRNPIFAISGYLEALGSPGLPDQQRRTYAEKALANLQRLNALFDDLIEIARLEYREDLIRAGTFDFQSLVDEVTDMLQPKAEEKGLALETGNPPLYVRADRSRVRQVLRNLIENAIAYTPEGTVRCRTRRRLDKVRVEVIDTGEGIDEDHLERIFDRFYRVAEDRARKSGGTGLGLSIVKQILQAHGEDIHVESTKGRGTRFWFELPHAEKKETVEPA